MKTKFNVELLKYGSHTEAITKMICNHNEGIANIDLDVICGYIYAKKAQYPSLADGRHRLIKWTKGTLHISEDEGVSFYMIITEVPAIEKNELTLSTNEQTIQL